MAKGFIYIKDARDDYRRESVFYAGSLYRELARRMEISPEDVSFLQEDEIIKFLSDNSKILKPTISQRKKGFVMYLDTNKKLVCIQGKQIEKTLGMFGLAKRKEEIKELKGMIASKGIATGKVVIVRGIKDLDKVEEGVILVAVTTHPDYVSAMRKASAIVTDEGGITSHAAIVAREFGIPCIVGTKQATKVLKDGVLVKVDAIDGKIHAIQ